VLRRNIPAVGQAGQARLPTCSVGSTVSLALHLFLARALHSIHRLTGVPGRRPSSPFIHSFAPLCLPPSSHPTLHPRRNQSTTSTRPLLHRPTTDPSPLSRRRRSGRRGSLFDLHVKVSALFCRIDPVYAPTHHVQVFSPEN
jgi:hypothetical protein